MSTFALGGSEAASATRSGAAWRYADLVVLALALPVFVLADLPLLGYVAAAVAWLTQRVLQVVAARGAARNLASGERRAAMGYTAAAVLGRVWLVALVVLVTGLVAEREDGLAAAVLAAVLFTVYFAAEAIRHIGATSEAR